MIISRRFPLKLLSILALVSGNGCHYEESEYIRIDHREFGVVTQLQRLVPADLANYDNLGTSIAAHGTTVIIGAPYHDVSGETNSGAAYIYVQNGTSWTQQAKLAPAYYWQNDYDQHGVFVALENDTALVGQTEGSGSVTVYTRSGTTWSVQQTITMGDTVTGGARSVAISGETFVSGSPGASSNKGEAYVYVRNGTAWAQQAKLTASDGAASDYFGKSVDISGNTVVISAYGDDDRGDGSGSAYVFERTGTSWTQTMKLTGSDSDANDEFGSAVSINPTQTIAIGSRFAPTPKGTTGGATYLFAKNGTVWQQQAKLYADETIVNGDQYGASVDLYGDLLAIGAPIDGTYAGAVYLYQLGQSGWSLVQKVTETPVTMNTSYGSSVGIADSILAVGAFEDDTVNTASYGNAGSGFVNSHGATRTPYLGSPIAGATFTSTQATLKWDANGFDVSDWWIYVGYSLGTPFILDTGILSANVLSTTVSNLPSNGSMVYIRLWYRLQGDLTWYYKDYQVKAVSPSTPVLLSPSNDTTLSSDSVTFSWNANYSNVTAWWITMGPVKGTAFDYDSGSIASNDTSHIATGLPTASQIIYARFWYQLNGTWSYIERRLFSQNWTPPTQLAQTSKHKASDGAAGDYFGNSIAIDNDWLIVGAPYDQPYGAGSGSAYFYQRSGTTWVQKQRVDGTATYGSTGDRFGTSVAIDGSRAVVGAYADFGKVTKSGTAYVYERSGTTWSYGARLSASDGASYDEFGYAVAVKGNTIAIGAPGRVYSGSYLDAGGYYIFLRSGASWTQNKSYTHPGLNLDSMGQSIALADANTMVIGMPKRQVVSTYGVGAVSTWSYSGTAWTQTQFITPTSYVSYQYFGSAVAVDGSFLVIGSYGDSSDGGTGSAYVYEKPGTSWTFNTKLTDFDRKSGDNFGSSVAVSGNTIVVGSPGKDLTGSNSGAAFVFTRKGTGWKENARLTANDAAASDAFGNAVAIDGETCFVAAFNDDDPSADSGSSYRFELALNPAMTSPTNGSTISSSSVTFQWSANTTEVDAWWIYVADTLGKNWFYDTGYLSVGTTTLAVSDIPLDGRTMYVRLWYQIDGAWSYRDYSYVTSSTSVPAFTSPTTGSTLSGSSETFQWTNNGLTISSYELWVFRGSTFYYINNALGSSTSDTATGLPTDGGSVTARLWYLVSGGSWDYVDANYTASGP